MTNHYHEPQPIIVSFDLKSGLDDGGLVGALVFKKKPSRDAFKKAVRALRRWQRDYGVKGGEFGDKLGKGADSQGGDWS